MATLLDWLVLISLLVFAGVTLFVWTVMSWLTRRRSATMERLEQIQTGNALADAVGLFDHPGAMQELFAKAAPALARPLEPKTEGEQSRLRLRLSAAGFRGDRAVACFLAAKFIGLVGGLVLAGPVAWGSFEWTQQTFIYTVIGVGVGFYMPDLAVAWRGKVRKEAIFFGLPDALDLMVVCVESGMGLDAAMRKVAEESRRTSRVLSEELNLYNLQLQMGRVRREALHDLGTRTGVDDLRSLAAILIQAERFGSSIAQALRVQSDSMRVRRRQLAEERAAKTAVKLIFPLVLFIFPGIFVVLVGPAAIQIKRNLMPAMGQRQAAASPTVASVRP
jgi:tight adherence protein C